MKTEHPEADLTVPELARRAAMSPRHFARVFSRGVDFIYEGQRRDLLRRVEGELRIAAREVTMDWNVVVAPSLGLFF